MVAFAGNRAVEPRRVERAQQRFGMRHRDNADGKAPRPASSAYSASAEGGQAASCTQVTPSASNARPAATTWSAHRSGSRYGAIERACASLNARSTSRPFSAPCSVAAERAARRIGSVGRNAKDVERGRRNDALVIAVVHDDDRPVEAQRIQVGAGRNESVLEIAPTDAAHPARVGFGRRLGEQQCMQRLRIARR